MKELTYKIYIKQSSGAKNWKLQFVTLELRKIIISFDIDLISKTKSLMCLQ